MKYKIFRATILNPISDTRCDLYHDGGLIVEKVDGSRQYKVAYLGHWQNAQMWLKRKKINKRSYRIFDKTGQLLMPSFYDMHFHWVQDLVRKQPKANLLKWLQKYTWPAESKFKSKEYSLDRARKFSQYLLDTGTLAGVVYASIHPHSVDHAQKHFKGDFVIGNVLMTMNSPDYLTQDSEQALAEVKKLSKKYKDKYALTPRIAPVTDPEVMKQGAAIVKKNNGYIQTHLSETLNEIEWVKEVYSKIPGFKKSDSYTEIYDKCHNLTQRTFLGHCIHMSDREIKLVARRRSKVVHCPTSNAPLKDGGLGSGLFDFKKFEKHKIPWALGSDIGAGPWLSMFDVILSFVQQNKKQKEATFIKGLFRSTLASARMLKQGREFGNLNKNKWGNFIFVPCPKTVTQKDDAENVLRKLLTPHRKQRQKMDKLVKTVFYKGQQLK